MVVTDCQITFGGDIHIVAIVGINICASCKLLFFSVEPIDAASGGTEIKDTIVTFRHALHIIVSQSFFTVLIDIFFLRIVHVDTYNSPPMGYPKVVLRIYQKIASFCICFRSLRE